MTPEQIAAKEWLAGYAGTGDGAAHVANLLAHIDTLTAAVPDVETLARAMVEADLDDIAEPDDILDSMPEARQMAERIIAEYRAILNDSAREKPSALSRDIRIARSRIERIVERDLQSEAVMWAKMAIADLDAILARLTEPDAGEGTCICGVEARQGVAIWKPNPDCPVHAPTPDTTEATLAHIAWAQDVRSEHEATHGEAEQCGAECIALGLAEFDYESPA